MSQLIKIKINDKIHAPYHISAVMEEFEEDLASLFADYGMSGSMNNKITGNKIKFPFVSERYTSFEDCLEVA
jgi:hypothetical protein